MCLEPVLYHHACNATSKQQHSRPARLHLLEAMTNVVNLAGHSFRRSAAGAFGPDLAKKLSQLVKMEKNVMRSMELVGRERMETAVSTTNFNS